MRCANRTSLRPERGQAVHLEAQQLIEVVLGRERQVEHLAEPHARGEAQRDPAAPPVRLAQQGGDLRRLPGSGPDDPAQLLLPLADDLGDAEPAVAERQDQAMPVAGAGSG